jgi:hypothetical protein
MEVAFRKLTEEQFDGYFTLVDNHIDTNAAFDGKMFETYGNEVAFVQEMAKQNRVITIVESDEGCDVDEEGFTIPNMYYVSGMHFVNRIGYLITEEPIEFEFECLID